MCKCTNDGPLRFLRDLTFAAFARNKMFHAKLAKKKKSPQSYCLPTDYCLLITIYCLLSLSLADQKHNIFYMLGMRKHIHGHAFYQAVFFFHQSQVSRLCCRVAADVNNAVST